MKKKIIIATLIAIFANVANAQETISGEELKERYLQAYEELDYCMKQMTEANNSIEARSASMSMALKLFYGKGEPYMEEGVMKPALKITIESYRGKVRKTVKAFFNGLAKGVHGSSKFTITNVPVPSFPANINVSDLRQVNDSIFSLVASVPQTFTGYKDGHATYKDVTTKKIQVYLLKRNVDGKTMFHPLLTGDVYVTEKKSL